MFSWNTPIGPRAADRKPGILIVDDFGTIRELLQIVLERAGFRVWLSENGPQAAETYGQHTEEIDLVVLDLVLPTWDGLVTATYLTQINPEVKFCIMTGLQSAYTQRELLSFGASRVFYKPFPLDRFVASMQALTSRFAVAC